MGAFRPMRNALDDHGGDIEPESEREHRVTVAPPPRGEAERELGRYVSGEARVCAGADGSR